MVRTRQNTGVFWYAHPWIKWIDVSNSPFLSEHMISDMGLGQARNPGNVRKNVAGPVWYTMKIYENHHKSTNQLEKNITERSIFRVPSVTTRPHADQTFDT